MTHNLWNGVRSLETLTRLGVKEYRAWRPVDTVRPSEMIGTEQYGRADLGFCKAVSARRGVIGYLAVQRITGVITASLSEPDGASGIHRDPAKTDHRLPFEIRYGGAEYHLNFAGFLPTACFVIQRVTAARQNRSGSDGWTSIPWSFAFGRDSA